MNIKKGDIVGRKSYGKDIFFIVDKILKTSLDNEFAILKGLNIRIMADSAISDLEIISREDVLNSIKVSNLNLEKRIKMAKEKMSNKLKRQRVYTGKILHLDGDRKYSEKSQKYYNKVRIKCYSKKHSRKQTAKSCYTTS